MNLRVPHPLRSLQRVGSYDQIAPKSLFLLFPFSSQRSDDRTAPNLFSELFPSSPLRTLCVLSASALSLGSLFFLTSLIFYLIPSFLPQPPLSQPPKRINPPIPKKRPIPPLLLALPWINLRHQYLFLLIPSFRQKLSRRIRHKRIPPKLNPRIAFLRLPLVPHAVHHRHKTSISNRMRPLNRLPGLQLRRSHRSLLVRMPSNTRWIKNHLRSLHRRQPRTFRIPLVPADLHANPRILRIKIQKSQISGRKIKFLIIKWIIRNMHLPVFPQIRSVRIHHRATVVINPRRPPLKHRHYQRHLLLLSHRRQALGSRPRHCLRQAK